MDKPSTCFWNRKYLGFGMFLLAFATLSLSLSIIAINPRIAEATDLSTGNVVVFDGSNAYISVPHNASLQPQAPFSYEVWAYSSNWSTELSGSAIMSKNEKASGGYVFRFTSTNIVAGVRVLNASCSAGSAEISAQYSKSSISSGWHLFSATFDGQYTRLYIDGALVNTSTLTPTGTCTVDYVNSGYWRDLRFGTQSVDTGQVYFSGKIDEAALYNAVLSQSSTTEHYAVGNGLLGTSADANLIAGWHFDEGTGTSVADYSDNGHTGSLTGNAVWGQRVVPPNSISSIAVGNIGTSTVTITWQTGNSSDSQIEYGISASYGSIAQSSTTVTSHSISLTGLSATTTYHFKITSGDEEDQLAISTDQTFITLDSDPTNNIFYAAPNGSANYNGSIGSPWTLTKALSMPSTVQPGAIIYLRGGTYTLATTSNQFGWTSVLTGTAAEPIIVKSFPGEHAVLNGDSTGVSSALIGAAVLHITGNYTWFEDFEITNTQEDNRRLDQDYNSATDPARGQSVNDYGIGTKLINLVIHDTLQGIGAWVNAYNNEYYGNVIYNNGIDATDGLHGHGIYTQNNSGWKNFFNNIIVNSFAMDMQVYGTSDSYLNNYTFEGNTFMNNGVQFGGGPPMNNIRVYRNYFFRLLSGPTFGYTNYYNNSIFIRNNYIASSTLTLQRSTNVKVTNNTIIIPSVSSVRLISLNLNALPSNSVLDYTFNNNTYYKPFGDIGESFAVTPYDTLGFCPYFWFNPSSQGYNYTCGALPSAWQNSLGYDLSGTYNASAPSIDAIFYRKNKYDANRMSAIAYNWDGNTTVSIDPSLVLDSGDSYEIRNSQDYFDDVITGAYDGNPIPVSMDTGTRTLEKPIGYDYIVANGGWHNDPLKTTTFPIFGTFIIINTSGTTDVADPVISDVTNDTIGTSTATIWWDTDEDSTTLLEFGPTVSYGTSSTTDDGTLYGTFYTTFHEISLTGLSPGTLYHYRLTSADYSGNSVTSGDYTFTTTAIASTITTSAASSINTTSATLNGEVTAFGGSATEHGFAWGTSSTLGGDAATTTLGAKSGTGAFASALSSLTCNTAYYARAYATNSAGTGYGTIVSFTTSACPAAEEPVAAPVDSSTSMSGTGRRNRILPGTLVSQSNLGSTYVSAYPTIIYPADFSSGVEVDSTQNNITTPEVTYTPPSILSSLPGEFLSLVRKFPSLGKTLSNIAVRSGEDALDTLKNARLSLPNLSRESGSSGIPISSLTPIQKESLPEEVIFARSGDLIDYNVSLTVSDEGTAEQVIHTIAGKPIDLALKPDKPVKSIKGYLTVKNLRRNTAMKAVKANSMVAASIAALLAQTDRSEEEKVIDEKAVMAVFDYSDPDMDGIYTASITAPMIHGEYDIMTIMEYKDDKLGAKEFHLTTVVDPEGYIFRKHADGEIRLENAIVTIYKKNSNSGSFDLWPADKYEQTNPQKTNATGMYSFLVPEGTYKLTVTASGYRDYNGPEFEVIQGSGIHENIELRKKGFFSSIFGFFSNLF